MIFLRFIPVILLPLLALGVLPAAFAQTEEKKPMSNLGEKTFTVFDAPSNGETLLSVPFYFAPGEVPDLKSAVARDKNGKTVALQAHVLSRHPADKSVRAAMLRGMTKNLKVGETFSLTPQNSVVGKSLLKVENNRAQFSCGSRRIVFEDGSARIFRGEKLEASVAPLAPDFPKNFLKPVLEIVENGPQFAWLAATFSGPKWKVRFEIKADATGQIEFTSRLLADKGEHEFPRFGLRGEVAGFSAQKSNWKINGANSSEKQFLLRDENRRVQTLEFVGSTPNTVFTFLDGAHIRQGRLEIDGTNFQMWRDPALDKTKTQYLFREGQERSFALVLPAPGSTPGLARGHVSSARRAAVALGEAPTDWGDLQNLRYEMASLAPKLQSLDGDDWGDLDISVARENPVYAPASLTRLDHGEDFISDYFLGGQRVLADVALRWASNYLELHLYRGANKNAFGAERYAISAENTLPNFNQKGHFLLMHAFEETGDVRFKDAALATADRAAALMETNDFYPTYDLQNGFFSGNNTRTTYIAADLCKFYDFTGDEKYLKAARKIIEKLEEMRVRTALVAELTTNFHTGQKSAPLLSEGVGSPELLGDLALHSDGTGVSQSPGGFPKPFILDYHLRGALALLEREENAAARSLLITTANYLAENRNLFGTWNYPQVHSPHASGQITASIGDDFLLVHKLTGDEKYLQVAVEQAKFLTQLFDATRSANYQLQLAGGKPYFYAEDFSVSDLYRSSISTSQVSRDFLAHAFTFYNHYFARFPAQTKQLRAPLQNPNARWIVEKMFIENRADKAPHPIMADYAAAEKTEPTRAFEKVLEPSKITPEIANCFIYKLQNEAPSDDGGVSTLRLFEDGKELLPAHALHAKIRVEGSGHWSHWGKYGNRLVMFSSSDNSDPRTNGRKYVALQESIGTPEKAFAAWEDFLKKYPDSLWEHSRLAELAVGPPRESGFLEKFVAAFPNHPRAGTARARLYKISNDAKWLRENIALLPGSIWAREAATLLWAQGEGARPEHVLADDENAATNFRETRDLEVAKNRTEIFVRREKQGLVLRVVARDWKKTAPANTSFQLYFDASEDHEHWFSFAVQANSELRTFTDHSWPGQVSAPLQNESDWSAVQTGDGDDLVFEVAIPFAKLGISPQENEPVLLGFEAIRRDAEEISFWCHSTKPDAVYPGNFGRLLLRAGAGSTPKVN